MLLSHVDAAGGCAHAVNSCTGTASLFASAGRRWGSVEEGNVCVGTGRRRSFGTRARPSLVPGLRRFGHWPRARAAPGGRSALLKGLAPVRAGRGRPGGGFWPEGVPSCGKIPRGTPSSFTCHGTEDKTN